MPDETHVLRGINWRETFPFTNIFRSFRVAIHPSKLILALLAILMIYIAGRLLDGMTPVSDRGIPNEIEYYESFHAGRMMLADGRADVPELNERVRKAVADKNADFFKFRHDVQDHMQQGYAEMLVGVQIKNSDGKVLTPDEAKAAAKSGKYMGAVKDKLVEERNKQADEFKERYKIEKEAADDGYLAEAKAADDQYFGAVNGAEALAKAQRDAADKMTDAKARDDARNAANKAEADAKTKATEDRKKALDTAKASAKTKYDALKGDDKDKEEARRKEDRRKVEDDYVKNVRALYTETSENWAKVKTIEGKGLYDQFMDYEINRVNDVVAGVFSNNWFGGLTNGEPAGVFASALRFFTVAPRWAFRIHPIYFVMIAVVFMIVWALFGGAIARIAAVHVAREEKLSMRQALRFSSGKFLSFVFAPIIPIAIIVFVGVIVAIGGLLLYIPYVGEFLVGAFFFLALAAGFVMTLVALGTFGGLNLMYPTIAVEGSDSFDAISRSFSYVYARPWRMLWYTVVAIAYGAATFLFVRLFIWLTLAFTHKAVGYFIVRTNDAEQNVWNAIWPGSGVWHLPYHIDYLSLTAGQSLAAFLVSIWVYIVIAFLGAYLVSYYFASSTVIYYLMRREVDATELDDVYVEQSDDDFAEPTTAAPAGATAVVETTTVTVTTNEPPPTPPADSSPPPNG